MIKKRIKNRYLLVTDIFLCFLAYAMIICLVKPLPQFVASFTNSLPLITLSAFIYVLSLQAFHLYQVDWLYSAVKEYMHLLFACAIAGTVLFLFDSYIFFNIFSTKEDLAIIFSTSVLICFLRFLVRIFCKMRGFAFHPDGKRVLIIGAGSLAVSLLRTLEDNNTLNYNVVGLIDDNAEKTNQRIYGSRVLGKRRDIPRICQEQDIEEILFAIYNLTPKDKTEILDICSSTGKTVKILPGMEVLLHGLHSSQQLRQIEIEDLLERDPIVLDNHLIANDIQDRVVLVTGGGGSIGSELCRQILRYNPAHLVIVDIYENSTYELQNELEETYSNTKISVRIASIRDRERLMQLFMEYRPEIVFHAAAHKHVPLMEFSPQEAIKNNVFGTYNTALCAEAAGVKRFVMISTDKAVNPTNVMGATKRMCEMIVEAFQKNGKTEFVAVRFGNVLGSNGSVIPRFKKQIAQGGPVTVTHPDITRFFMTIPEAAQLVLQAAAYAKGGEIFVLDMGSSVRIYDLAKKMISLSGLRPEIDIKITFSGLRPGEKLYEELLMLEEGLQKTAHSKIFVGKQLDITMEELNGKLDRLRHVLDEKAPTEEIKAVLAEVVPTYRIKTTA